MAPRPFEREKAPQRREEQGASGGIRLLSVEIQIEDAWKSPRRGEILVLGRVLRPNAEAEEAVPAEAICGGHGC